MKWITTLLEKVQALLDYDFCPGLNPWFNRLKHPLVCITVIGVVVIISSLMINPRAWPLVAAILAISLLGVIWPRIAIQGVECQLSFDRRRCREGQPAKVKLNITNKMPWPVWGLSLQKGFVISNGHHEGLALACVRGRSTTEFFWDFTPTRRGIYPLESPIMETGFPFGISFGRKPVRFTGNLMVWPVSVELKGLPDAREIQPRQTQFADRRVGDMGDTIGTREFRTGDPIRRIHWAQTARHRRLIVTERQAPAACAVQLLVDIDQSSHTVSEQSSTLEQTLKIAASISESFYKQHAEVDCQIGQQHFAIGGNLQQLHALLDYMALIPALGIANSNNDCKFHQVRKQSCLLITTTKAFRRHLRHSHSGNSRDRFVIVNPDIAPESSGEFTSDCGCHAWLEVETSEPIKTTLSLKWQKACHV